MKNLKLIGSRITRINAERNVDFTGKLEIKTNIKINKFQKIEDRKNSIKIPYEYEINYGELGKVNIKGELFLSGDSKIIKELMKITNNKEKNTPEYLKITNLIIQKATIKAFELEEELNLPIHIKLPEIKAQS
jgi:hypothetical protein